MAEVARAAAGAHRFLALGDSYTIGEGVPATGRWPVRLRELAVRGGVSIRMPRIIARTGWSTDELARAVDEAAPRGPFGLVSLLIGVNDQYRGYPTDDYRRRFEALLDRAVTLAGAEPGRVIVLSIPDWGVTPFAASRDSARITAAIDEHNLVNREAALARGARHLDVTTLSRERGREPAMLAADGLHPSAAMYAEWAALALPLALDALAVR